MPQLLRKCIYKFHSFLFWLWRQDGTPSQRARGLGIGVFSGCFPLFGFQTLLALILARCLRGNKLLAMVSTWISNPFTYLPLYWLNYRVGCYFLGEKDGNFEYINWNQFWDQGFFFIVRLFFGSFIVGSFSSLIIGYSTYLFLRHINQKKVVKSRDLGNELGK